MTYGKAAMSSFSHLHAHSHFSVTDAVQTVDQMVGLAAHWGQPAMALTDHGNMSGSVQLYKAGKKYGVQVFPGFEGYLVEDVADIEAKRYHFGLLATSFRGFRALCRFSSLSHTRPNFHKFPRHDLANLADLASGPAADDMVLLTGCYFGLVQQTLVTKGAAAAQRVVEMYARWFPNTVVEIQNHNIEHEGGVTDGDIVEALSDIADKLGLPVVATQDSHYLSLDDKAAHSTMKRMVYRQGDANEFPGDSFHFASSGWVRRHYTDAQWARSEEGHAHVLSLHDLQLPALDDYKPFVPRMAKNPVARLKKLVEKALLSVVPWSARFDSLKLSNKYRDRLDYELSIINKLGYADYFLHVLDLVTFCNDRNIVIEARGSANASLVCFLLGITQIDPFQKELIFDGQPLTFERFLSLDRQKPPDIDIDIEDARRIELVEYARSKRYNAISIGNYSQLGERDDGKGSILVTYNSYLRSQMSPALFTHKFGPKGVESIADIRRISQKDYEGVKRLARCVPFKSYGVHAAGLLLPGAHLKIEDYVPTMLVPSSDTVVSQYTMDDVEAIGLLKDDVLGQRTLRVMARCQELMGQDDKRDFSWIPYDDPETCRMLSEGRPNNAVFQFEGYTMAKGARVMGIKNTRDCILAAALFRPAGTNSGVTDLYLKRRSEPALRANLRFPHPAFERALRSTHGCVLFQEQVLQIMRDLGLDYAGINTFFKIVKDSGKGATARNVGRATEVKKQWDDICKKNGIKDVEGAWHYIEGYVQYGFNQAHATGYGVRSYRCAYLKTHYPLEFMTAVLESVAGRPKKPGQRMTPEELYTKEARRMGIRILSPDINISNSLWTMDRDRNAITKGLGSIRGISVDKAAAIVAARPAGGWESAAALAESLPAGILTGRNQYLDLAAGKTRRVRATGEDVPRGGWTGAMKALMEAGSLESLGVSRFG